MNLFKSVVASAISSGVPNFPYTFGDRQDLDGGIWVLQNGQRRVKTAMTSYILYCITNNVPQDDGSNCSIFSFDINANKSRLPLARNALKKLRTLRHPGVIKVLDTAEVRYPSVGVRRKSYERSHRQIRPYILLRRE